MINKIKQSMYWYQVKALIERVQEDRSHKTVTEDYLVEAFSFAEAERITQEEIAQSASGEFDIVAVARKNYSEVIESNLGNEIADRWYKCKVNFITLNERNGKEMRTSKYFLVQSSSALTAHSAIDCFMQSSMSDYEVEKIEETKILEVLRK